ncbi:MAG: hypothetical protein IAE78_08835 [Myxococcus sp.]|nr:hypothetical protein [Myxococcus sp.]
MSWKARVGWAVARLVSQVGAQSHAPRRGLSARERAVLGGVFGASLDLEVIVVREALSGLINLSRRAFVIENTMHLPLPVGAAPMHLLVHEATHVWQFQHGGHAYITDSLHAQTLGDGYQLEKGLLQGRAWAELNCEQQATLVEQAWAQGCFEGRPFVLRGRDWTAAFLAAREAWRAGRGATFTSSGGTPG